MSLYRGNCGPKGIKLNAMLSSMYDRTEETVVADQRLAGGCNTRRGCSGALPPCPLGTVSWVTSDSTSPVSSPPAQREDRAWGLATEVDYSYFFTIIMLCKTWKETFAYPDSRAAQKTTQTTCITFLHHTLLLWITMFSHRCPKMCPY